LRRHLELDRLAWISRLRDKSDDVSGFADTVCEWALAVGTEWWWEREVGGIGWDDRGEWPNRDWLRERREPRDKSASLDTKWEVLCPTTPF